MCMSRSFSLPARASVHPLLAVGLVITCGIPATSHAGTVVATFLGMKPAGKPGVTVTVSGVGSVGTDDGGIFKWRGDQEYFFEKKPSYGDKRFLTFCIEVAQGVGSTTFTSTTDIANYIPNGGSDSNQKIRVAGAVALTKLWAYELPRIKSGAFGDSVVAGGKRNEIAAMQLAIWELVNDSGVFNLEDGDLTAVSNNSTGNKILAGANALYTESQAHDFGNTQLPTLVALTNKCKQDQLTATTPVPEPTSLVAWCLLGLAGLVYRRRSRC